MCTIKVVVVQTYSNPGDLADNFSRAKHFIELAHKANADFVVFPELYACGYIPNPDIWNYAEEGGGQTYFFLKEMARKYKIIIGMGYLAKDGDDFCNRYLIVDQKGQVLLNADKDKSEAYIFKRGRGVHTVDTPYGRWGIGICADNHFSSFIKYMQESRINLMIMPHAMPIPKVSNGLISEKDKQRAEKDIKEFPGLIARLLGVPTIFANLVGECSPMIGIMGKMMTPDKYILGGNSRIVDKTGEALGSSENSEALIIADIAIDSESTEKEEIPNFDGWIQDGSKLFRRLVFPIDLLSGLIYYRLNRRRT
jgi:N-carbamoylputrescine amidase